MIRQAIAVTRYLMGEPPVRGMVTFLDTDCVQPIMVRGQKTWGRTWILAGFEPDGVTKGGLLAFRLRPENMPAPVAPLVQHELSSLYRSTVDRYRNEDMQRRLREAT